MSVRPLNEPVATPVRAEQTVNGVRPAQVFNRRTRRWLQVEHIVDSWVVDDRWWTDEPIRRAYFACQTEDGSVSTLFCNLADGSWHAQR